jgi:hypothetical protein
MLQLLQQLEDTPVRWGIVGGDPPSVLMLSFFTF